jgi:hypothetical protein
LTNWPGVAVESATMNDDFIQIGMRDGWEQPIPFGISLPDLRQHIYVIGKTGSGKTTLLRNMIIQHIALGYGVGLIDPHGDLAEELLNHIPRWRTDHLVLFQPVRFGISGCPEFIGERAAGRTASGRVRHRRCVQKHLAGFLVAEDGIDFIQRHRALLDCQNTSLFGVNRMLRMKIIGPG